MDPFRAIEAESEANTGLTSSYEAAPVGVLNLQRGLRFCLSRHGSRVRHSCATTRCRFPLSVIREAPACVVGLVFSKLNGGTLVREIDASAFTVESTSAA